MRAELKKWQVQVRLSRKHKWRAKGTFETRKAARERSADMRGVHQDSSGKYVDGYGFGCTRVVRKITRGL